MHAEMLVAVIQNISALMDTRLHDDLSIEDVTGHIRAGYVLRFVADLGGIEVDFFPDFNQRAYNEFDLWYTTRLGEMLAAFPTECGQGWGVKRQGLCLLLSWTAELLNRPGVIQGNWA